MSERLRIKNNGEWTLPNQSNRLEQLKAKHPNLTDDEKTELLDILLTQKKEQ